MDGSLIYCSYYLRVEFNFGLFTSVVDKNKLPLNISLQDFKELKYLRSNEEKETIDRYREVFKQKEEKLNGKEEEKKKI